VDRYKKVAEEVEVANIEKSIEIEVSVRTAYNQWTQFEEFPRFTEGVQQVGSRNYGAEP
jgi:hypothetical protein